VLGLSGWRRPQFLVCLSLRVSVCIDDVFWRCAFCACWLASVCCIACVVLHVSFIACVVLHVLYCMCLLLHVLYCMCVVLYVSCIACVVSPMPPMFLVLHVCCIACVVLHVSHLTLCLRLRLSCMQGCVEWMHIQTYSSITLPHNSDCPGCNQV